MQIGKQNDSTPVGNYKSRVVKDPRDRKGKRLMADLNKEIEDEVSSSRDSDEDGVLRIFQRTTRIECLGIQLGQWESQVGQWTSQLGPSMHHLGQKMCLYEQRTFQLILKF